MLLLTQRLGILHFSLYDEKNFIRIIIAHFIFMSFFNDVIYDFSQIDFDISVTIGLHIKDAAL